MVGKVFKKLVNNRLVEQLEIYVLFSDFQYGFRFSRSAADLLTVVSDARAFNSSRATRAIAPEHASLLHKLKSYGILGRYLALFCLFSVTNDLKWHLYSKYDLAFSLWQQIEMAATHEYDLRDTVDWGRKWLVDFNNTSAIDVKMDGSVLKENSAFKMLELSFSSKLKWGSYIISIAKTNSMNSPFPKVALYLYQSTKRPCMEYCCHI